MKTWLASLLFFLSASGFAETINEVIRFQTLGRGVPPMSIQAELRIPPKAQPPYKTVILQHSSGPTINLMTFNGRTDNVAHIVGLEALKRGYAVIFTDSFTPREIEVSHRVGSKEIGARELSQDLFFLVRHISSDPRFNTNNLFFFGHSLGGSLALEVSYQQLWRRARWLSHQPTPFKAVVASAPGCHITRVGVIAQPLKIFVGQDDDWTPAAPCVDFVKEQQALGAIGIEIELIPKVGHSYSSYGTSWNSQAISFRGCTHKRVQLTEDGRFKQGDEVFDHNEYKKRCHTVGATSMGPGDRVSAVAMNVLNYFDGF